MTDPVKAAEIAVANWKSDKPLREAVAEAIRKAQQEGFDAGCMHAMSDKMDGTTPGVDKAKVLKLLDDAENYSGRTSTLSVIAAVRLIVEGMK